MLIQRRSACAPQGMNELGMNYINDRNGCKWRMCAANTICTGPGTGASRVLKNRHGYNTVSMTR